MTTAIPKLITLEEAATLIDGVDAATLRRRVRQGKLNAYRPGGFYMTTVEDVREFIEACRVKPKVRDCGSSPPVELPAGSLSKRFGASVTAPKSSALASLTAKMEARRSPPKQPCQPTLTKS